MHETIQGSPTKVTYVFRTESEVLSALARLAQQWRFGTFGLIMRAEALEWLHNNALAVVEEPL